MSDFEYALLIIGAITTGISVLAKLAWSAGRWLWDTRLHPSYARIMGIADVTDQLKADLELGRSAATADRAAIRRQLDRYIEEHRRDARENKEDHTKMYQELHTLKGAHEEHVRQGGSLASRQG